MKVPELLPSELLRFASVTVRAAVAHSGPTHRASAHVPHLQELALFITNQRLILRAEIFMGLFDSDFVARLPGARPGTPEDTLTFAEVHEMPILGKYLEIKTQTAQAHALRGDKLRLKLFFSEATQAREALPATLA